MQRFVLPAAITFAFLLGLMLLLRRDAESEVLTGADNEATSVERDAGELTAPAAEVAERAVQRRVAQVGTTDHAAPTTDAPAGTATLVVTVTSREGGDPLSRVPIFIDEGRARTHELLVSGKVGSVGVGVESDYEGVARFTVPAGVRLRVIPRHPGYKPGADELVDPLVMTAFGVSPLDVDESREQRVHISTIDGELHLAVLDDVTGAPVPNAELRLSDRVITRTNASGRAIYPLKLDAYSALEVVAPGYGLAVVPLRDRREGADDPLVVRLFAAATLRGQVLGLDSPTACSLRISASKHELVQPVGRPSWGMSVGTMHRSVALDEYGSFAVDDLPPRAALTVELDRGTGHREPLSTDELRLEPGEARTMTWDLGALATIVGRVVDEHGQAVADREVAVEGGNSIVWFGEQEHPVLASTRTDDAGRFEFQGLEARDVVVGVVPMGDRDERMAAPKAARHVVLRNGYATELELVLPGETFLEARVFDALGQPAAGMLVHLQSDHAAPAHATSDATGLVRLGPLVPGAYRVATLARQTIVGAPPEPLEVVVPCDPIEIRLQTGAVAAGRIVDAVTGQPVTVNTSLQQSFGESMRITVRGLGVTEFRHENLSPGTYHFIAEEAGGRVGVLRDVELDVGEVRDDLVIPMHPAGTLRVTYGGDRKDLRVRVRDGEVVLHEEELAPNALSTCRVPTGSVLVELVVTDWTKPAADREVADSRRVDVPADERVDVAFD